eukprot:210251_1
MSTFCCVIFALHLIKRTVSQSGACDVELPCKWIVDGHELDFTPFQRIGLTLTGGDIQYTYKYSICNNLARLYKSTQNGYYPYPGYPYSMIQQTDNNHHTYLANYDPFITPSIKLNEDFQPILWYFNYSQNFSVQFSCNYSIPMVPPYFQMTQVLELLPGRFLMQISSAFVCHDITAPYNLSYDECIWFDEASGAVLDLRQFYGDTITSGIYTYTVCQNGFRAPRPYCGMFGSQVSQSPDMYALWYPSYQPQYDPDEVTWTFRISNYNNAFQWICDHSIDIYQVVTITGMKIAIASKHACNQPEECVFIDPDNPQNSLNLQTVTGDMIEFIGDDLTYSYQYTPCSNYVDCNGELVMAQRWNIAERTCDRYLAKYDVFDGYKLFYNESAVEWKFTYYNGEPCTNGQISNTEFEIYWTCNQSVNGWDVINVEEIDECVYSMHIDSSIAC